MYNNELASRQEPAKQKPQREGTTMLNIRNILFVVMLFTVCSACGSSDADTSSENSDDSVQGLCKTPPFESKYNTPGCRYCLCEKCPELIEQCDENCFRLIICMHENCNEDVAALDDCSQNACSQFQAGLEAAKNIASCMYDPSDRGPGENKSCFVDCLFSTF